MSEASRQRVSIILATAVVVTGLYNVFLFGPATPWLVQAAYRDFGSALPSPSLFVVDLHWYLWGLLVAGNAGTAARALKKSSALPIVAIMLNIMLTIGWVWAMWWLPTFSIAGAVNEATTRLTS